jgi:hypothetical protein
MAITSVPAWDSAAKALQDFARMKYEHAANWREQEQKAFAWLDECHRATYRAFANAKACEAAALSYAARFLLGIES